jgi:hypothetical protein
MYGVGAFIGGKMSVNALGSKSIDSRGSTYAVLVELANTCVAYSKNSHPQIMRRPVLTE